MPFSGDGSGESELTWGQRNIMRMMQLAGEAVMIGGTVPLEEGTTVEHIVNLLAFIVERNQSLRTRYRFREDGEPVQVLYSSGEVALDIVDIGLDEDPAEAAEAVRSGYEHGPFDVTADWPVKMAVLRRAGVPVYFAAMYPHIAIDGLGFEALVGDLRNLDRDTGAHLAPREGMQPFELARQQQGATALRQSAASVDYWEKMVRLVPGRRFDSEYEPRDPQWSDVTLDSKACHLAATSIAARTGANTGSIVLGAYAVGLAKVSGKSTSAIRTFISNRFRPGLRESVTPLLASCLCVVDVADTDFDTVAQRAWRSQLKAGKYAYFDPRDLLAMFARVAAERGEEVDLLCYFNDLRREFGAPRPGPLPTPEEIEAALPLTTLTWGPHTDVPDAQTFMELNPVPDTLNLMLRVDTEKVTPEEQEVIVREMERILVAAAFDPACPSGIAANATLSTTGS
ncbi:condensation domain protein [Catenulispora acidiphila DSM 44928]|uniref:Condensation domain protein n=1 Tax=Catenulispora acidiphila (strain DSM 44928 / JCM 14897 / NBRC 102108 / NRRL B-24433 / ID139908) TaxID=479433 RepID=C7PZL7_CATAD|nr:condensation domain protein [Catenulispora acidiphila DSM 44928]